MLPASPPPTPKRPDRPPDPRRELIALAAALAQSPDRRLLIEYLRLRRSQ